MGTWRYSCGQKAVNRVTVFERNDGNSIYIEWWDDTGRNREVLRTTVGHPVTDRELAKKIAHRASEAQLRKRNQSAAEAVGVSLPRTLRELFTRRYQDLASTWSEKYRKSRARVAEEWLARLGDVRLTSVNSATAERLIREEAAERKLSRRWQQDQLRFLRDSFIYAERKLKWVDTRHNLSELDIPSPRGRSLAYTLEEARALLPALWDVDPVAGWMGTVALQTGRRLGAIRQLRERDVELHGGGWTRIRFPEDTDKADREGVAWVYELPERTDWTVPSEEQAIDWIHEAEERAGVAHQDGRAWHGLKRLYATLSTGLTGADQQAGTRRETLEGIYRQQADDPKREVAKILAGRFGRP